MMMKSGTSTAKRARFELLVGLVKQRRNTRMKRPKRPRRKRRKRMRGTRRKKKISGRL
jgi:hypothetical protein